jgi:hypothetical protein
MVFATVSIYEIARPEAMAARLKFDCCAVHPEILTLSTKDWS